MRTNINNIFNVQKFEEQKDLYDSNFIDICEFQEGFIKGNSEILPEAANVSDCALKAKQSSEFATGASFKNNGCVATYGNAIIDDSGHWSSCLFPGIR